jgi:AbrB family looped-hinge helix DNA binding protein
MLITMRKNAQITLPASIRRKARLQEGDILEAEVRDDVIILRPKKLVDKSQAWFWSNRWQEGEKAAQADIEHGRVKEFGTVDQLIEDLRGSTDR